MKKIPTAEEILDNAFLGGNGKDITEGVIEAMIEFAKLHTEAALKAASEKALLGNTENGVYSVLAVSKESILNAYSLENIK